MKRFSIFGKLNLYNLNSRPNYPIHSSVARDVYNRIAIHNVSESVFDGIDNATNIITSVDVDKLKYKFPQFFGISTDGCLTVYIWQMAENNYKCYLINTHIDELSDQSFVFEVGVTVSEMRLIISTYPNRKRG